MSEHDTTTGDQDSSTDEQVVPATVTSDGERVVVVTPDGMGVAHHDEQPQGEREGRRERPSNPADLVEQPAKVMRIGSMGGLGRKVMLIRPGAASTLTTP